MAPSRKGGRCNSLKSSNLFSSAKKVKMAKFDKNAEYYVRVGKLRSALEDLPEDMLVVMSKDSEGNRYSPLADLEKMYYYPDNSWSGEVRHPDEVDEEPNDEECVEAIVLWPTN
jgi:hypothetical protein